MVVVPLCVIPLLASELLTISFANEQSNLALKHVSQDRLISLRDVKKLQIEAYFATVYNQLLNLAGSELVTSALINLTNAAQNYAQDSNQLDQIIIQKQLKEYYDTQFASHYAKKNSDQSSFLSAPLLKKLDINALALQNTFIAKNPAPLGEKDNLINAGDGSQYADYHARYHPYLHDFLKRFGFYDIFLVDADSGMIVYTVFKEIDFATSLKDGAFAETGIGQVYKKAMNASGKDSVSLVDYAPYLPSYQDMASFIASPIMLKGQKKGILIFQMPVDRINKIMTFDYKWSEAGLGATGETYLIGPDNRSRSESRFLLEDKDSYLAEIAKSTSMTAETVQKIAAKGSALGLQTVESTGSKAALNGQTGFDVFADYRGVSVLSAYAPLNIDGLRWAILAEIDEAEAFADATQLSVKLWEYSIVILTIMTIVAAAISIKFSQLISKPILQISNFIAYTATQLDLTRRLDMHSKDEIGQAAKTLNDLLHTFQQALKEVAEASNKIAEESVITSAVTEQTSQAVMAQLSETAHVASAISEMTETINEVAKNTSHTAAATEEATASINTGVQSMQQTTSIIHQLETIIDQSVDSIARLEQRSIDISGVLDVINNIAEQTNLLALNAAIEAARAGDKGRGFAVVADEVRTLASRTQQSTGEISALIEHLQNGSREAVTSMSNSHSQVIDAVKQSELTSQSLHLVSEIILRINNMSTQIAISAEEQGAVAKVINRNVGLINDMTSQTADGAKQTSAASRDLAQLAAVLSKVVNKFKL